MLYYWYRVCCIFLLRKFQRPLDINADFTRRYRVGLLDCDALRVMAAFKYPTYMDYIRLEWVARTRFFGEVFGKGLAPTLGSQKVVYRKPLKRGTKFTLTLHTAGWDDKWMYHVHWFKQGAEIKAVGVTKAMIWKKGKPQNLLEIVEKIGIGHGIKPPPHWVLQFFENDSNILSGTISQEQEV